MTHAHVWWGGVTKSLGASFGRPDDLGFIHHGTPGWYLQQRESCPHHETLHAPRRRISPVRPMQARGYGQENTQCSSQTSHARADADSREWLGDRMAVCFRF